MGKKYKKIGVVLLFIILFSFTMLFCMKNNLIGNKDNCFAQSQPDSTEPPKVYILNRPRKFDDFIGIIFKSISIELPKEVKNSYTHNGIQFLKGSKSGVRIALSVDEKNLIPNQYKGRYENNFEFLKSVLYERDDKELMSYKFMIMSPCETKDIETYEVEIGGNEGFLCQCDGNNEITYTYNLFVDGNNVNLKITVLKNSTFTKEMIDYIVSSIKTWKLI